ncbi:helix-turn-helix domain-containing protein [Actinomadura alba]|uniref:Helix-turn-helix transcriptional regulator n=1 Tax=Actinomadura alba TaxID=406431 RepID=A0ABR7LJK1_9ACTN|nr:helix-turn-helix transcriptional regulator [Actinomadura alba]MBC6464951.1 helix-turn-helix transcriptional regulator [Actinomadura alba]
MPRPQRDPDPDSLIGHFGAELRTYRNKAGLSMNQLAESLGCSPQWIGQVELAEKSPSEEFAIDLDTYFDSDGGFHRLWKSIKRATRRRVLLPGFPRYMELQREAALIRSFVAQLVPGLLQIEPYIRAVMNPSLSSDALDERVAARLEQQEILRREKPPHASFVLDEAVLHRPVGGPEVMREQLTRLAEFAESPHIQVRVLPFTSVTYAGLDGKFTLLRLGDGTEILYQEGPGIGQVIEESDTVTECAVRFDLVTGAALSRSESHKRIVKAVEDLR